MTGERRRAGEGGQPASTASERVSEGEEKGT